MPYMCCVPGCNGNYHSSKERVSVFSFPKDETVRQQWISAMQRKNFTPNKCSKVCERHFTDKDFVKVTRYFNEATGQWIEAPLYKPTLAKTAIPSLFPNYPRDLTQENSIRNTSAKMECLSEDLSECQLAHQKAKLLQLADMSKLCQNIIDRAASIGSTSNNHLSALTLNLTPSINQVFSLGPQTPLNLPEVPQIATLDPPRSESPLIPIVPPMVERDSVVALPTPVPPEPALICTESISPQTPEMPEINDDNPDSPMAIDEEKIETTPEPVPVTPIEEESSNVASLRAVRLNKSVEVKKQEEENTFLILNPMDTTEEKMEGSESLVACVHSMKKAKASNDNKRNLDSRVKTILMKSTRDFILHLFETGFISTRCFCTLHNSAKSECKLVAVPGQDAERFGGFIWQTKCCYKLYSIYKNSVFDLPKKYNISGPTLIKLIYHWCCQTPLSNVTTWVKLSKEIVCVVYKLFRSVCSIALQDSKNVLGSYTQIIEVGIIAYPGTALDKDRVSFLGLYDVSKNLYRIFCCRPTRNSRMDDLREILTPAFDIVYPHATLIADDSIDKEMLTEVVSRRFNLTNIEKTLRTVRPTNDSIMNFMKDKLRMFDQLSLSSFTLPEIQSCLDEICWREKYGEKSENCYNLFTEHIISLTSMEVKNEGVIPLLNEVTKNGAMEWRYNRTLMEPMPRYPMPTAIKNKFCDFKNLEDTANPKECNPVQHSNKSRSGQATVSTVTTTAPIVKPTLTNPKSVVGGQVSQKNLVFAQLEEYFYGRLTGMQSLGGEGCHTNLQCHICSEKFSTNNVKFFLHMKRHFVRMLELEVYGDFPCSYCVKAFPSDKDLTKHVVANHYMFDSSELWCRICALRFKKPDNKALRQHMLSTHIEHEIPYRCQVCHFGTSVYIEMIDHFNRYHLNASYIMCHLCLLVFPIPYNQATQLSKTVYAHLMSHSKNKFDCTKCNLTFMNKNHLTAHVEKEHETCKAALRLTKYTSQRGYKDMYVKSPPVVHGTDKDCFSAQKPAAMSRTLLREKLLILIDNKELKCSECLTHLIGYDHFKLKMDCSTCGFTTNCSRSLTKHYTMYHIEKSTIRKRKRLTLDEQELACNCGYTCAEGNSMAKHASKCPKGVKVLKYQAEPQMKTEPDSDLEDDDEYFPDE